MNALFIAGTDRGVGKTIVTLALAAYWQRYRDLQRLGLLKPIQCGSGDRELYLQLLPLTQPIESLNPIYLEPTDAAQTALPIPLAALQANQRIDLELIWRQLQALTAEREFVLVESTGGLGAPIAPETIMADLAWDWRLPTVLVADVHPGTIAQLVANVALAQQSRVHLKGILLNCVQPCLKQDLETWADVDLIESLTQTPVLGCIPHLTNAIDLPKLSQIASSWDLERLLPFSYANFSL